MVHNFFYKLGTFTHRFRIEIIALWIAGILVCIPYANDLIAPFQSTGFVATNSQSEKADKFLNKNLNYGNNQFLVIYHSKKLLATDKKYQNNILKSLNDLKKFPIPYELILPKDNSQQISKDKHTAYVVILFKTSQVITHDLIDKFQASIKKPHDMSMYLGGEPIFIEHINEQTQRDLFKADIIAAPVTIIALLLVFKTVVAAFIPVYIGASCALLILTILFGLGHIFSLSIFTLNIALLLGLCLSLDYALFIIYRYRDELNSNSNVKDAISKTMGTAGKAIFFSGIAVFISLSALLFFPINILFSIAVGGLTAVFIALSAALTLLPAILSVVNNKINSLHVLKVCKENTNPNVVNTGVWSKLANLVVNNPGLFSLSTLVFISILSYTVLNIKIGVSDYNVLPDHSENQKFFNIYKENFNKEGLVPIKLIISAKDSKITSNNNLAEIYKIVQKIKKYPEVREVDSIVSFIPNAPIKQYQYIFNQKPLDKNIKSLLNKTSRDKFTVITIISKYEPGSIQTKNLITKLKQINLNSKFTLQLSGISVTNIDVEDAILHTLPYACLWIISLTYLILLVLLRSILLPLQAIFMNILSLCASYGVLVLVFQEGYLHDLLHFKPQGMLDISLIVIIFCALFGFSMDYEVFLLTRIHEAYEATKDNAKSIIFGIVKSSKIITSAALIVILLCASFMFADVIMIKEFGLGIAIAIIVDAFAIRTILVPATMALSKDWNWYLPKWLNKVGSQILPLSSNKKIKEQDPTH